MSSPTSPLPKSAQQPGGTSWTGLSYFQARPPVRSNGRPPALIAQPCWLIGHPTLPGGRRPGPTCCALARPPWAGCRPGPHAAPTDSAWPGVWSPSPHPKASPSPGPSRLAGGGGVRTRAPWAGRRARPCSAPFIPADALYTFPWTHCGAPTRACPPGKGKLWSSPTIAARGGGGAPPRWSTPEPAGGSSSPAVIFGGEGGGVPNPRECSSARKGATCNRAMYGWRRRTCVVR